MPEIVDVKIYRNPEFIKWVESEFYDRGQKRAAIMAFSWLKEHYPAIVPMICDVVVEKEK